MRLGRLGEPLLPSSPTISRLLGQPLAWHLTRVLPRRADLPGPALRRGQDGEPAPAPQRATAAATLHSGAAARAAAGAADAALRRARAARVCWHGLSQWRQHKRRGREQRGAAAGA